MAPKVIYIAGFRQHAGKTVTSLGLISLLSAYYSLDEIGYLKPVGQELVELPEGGTVDKDCRIVQSFTGIEDMRLEMCSPVQLGSGFTKSYLDAGDQKRLSASLAERIEEAMEPLQHKSVVIAEGTGHPGVGGIVKLSNAQVANLLGADVLFLSGGGIGRALDQLEVDLTYFLHQKSRVKGILFNRVIPEKLETVRHYITEKVLENHYGGFEDPLKILGFLPAMPDLPRPSMEVIRSKVKRVEVLSDPPAERWQRPCRTIRVVSLRAEHMHLDRYISGGDLLLIGSGSNERIHRLIEYNRKLTEPLGGLVLTCGEDADLDAPTLQELKDSGIPTILTDEDTATTEQRILAYFENTKLQLFDTKKFGTIRELFRKHFDLDKFMEVFLHRGPSS
jgi:hypothetical protein